MMSQLFLTFYPDCVDESKQFAQKLNECGKKYKVVDIQSLFIQYRKLTAPEFIEVLNENGWDEMLDANANDHVPFVSSGMFN